MRDGDGKVLVEEAQVKERWKHYFSRLYNGGDSGMQQVGA